MIWVAFGLLGLLIGNLTGMSGSPIASVLIPTLFTLFGGSLLAFFTQLDQPMRVVSSQCLAAFSSACLVGVYVGVIVNSRQLLGPPPFRSVDLSRSETDATAKGAGSAITKEAKVDGKPTDITASYLRSAEIKTIDVTRRRVESGEITKEQGYDDLLHSLNP